MHQGAYDRTLTRHAAELTIISRMHSCQTLPSCRNSWCEKVVTLEKWHPISYVRQHMMKHAFSGVNPMLIERLKSRSA